MSDLLIPDGDLGNVPPEDAAIPAAFAPSTFTQRLYSRLPECYRVADLPGQPLYRWGAGMGDTASEVESLLDRFEFIPPPDGGPSTGPGSTSDLVDPATADPGWLGWIAFLLNVTRDSSAPLPTQRAQLENAQQGWNAGTVMAIRDAAKAYLTGSQIVTVTQQIGDQWHYTVSVFTRQIEGPTYGELGAEFPSYALLDSAFATYGEFSAAIAELTAALIAQNPAGMVQTFQTLSSPLYREIDSAFTPYSALDAHFTLYSDMASYIP
jgi:hypothetical protein